MLTGTNEAPLCGSNVTAAIPLSGPQSSAAAGPALAQEIANAAKIAFDRMQIPSVITRDILIRKISPNNINTF
jgi:hypothetical protein